MQWGIKEFKAGFFDRPIVDAVAAGEKRVVSRAAAFVRQRARSSIKYGKGKSGPGRPPLAHRSAGFTRTKKGKDGQPTQQPSSPLRELIFFAYDARTRSAVIGPAAGGSRTGAPKNLEKGGTAIVDGRPVRVAARPFMVPAARAEAPKFPDLLRNMVS